MISKAKLGEFSSITIFSDEYLLVERNGLFNLIDNNGNYISRVWYKEITKNNGGGADFVEVKTNRKIQLRSVPLIATYGSIRTALNNTSILSRIDTRCIAIVSPYKVYSATTSKYITIVAKVALFGKELFLGKNGKLYTKDNSGDMREYTLPEFFISFTDINRLVEIADNFNSNYNSEYDIKQKCNNNSTEEIKRTHTCCWIFGFDNSGRMTFNTSTNQIIQTTTTKAWGGDTIKLRIDIDGVPELYRDNLLAEVEINMDFEPHKTSCNWYTKEYSLDELNDLFDDMKVLGNKINFRRS